MLERIYSFPVRLVRVRNLDRNSIRDNLGMYCQSLLGSRYTADLPQSPRKLRNLPPYTDNTRPLQRQTGTDSLPFAGLLRTLQSHNLHRNRRSQPSHTQNMENKNNGYSLSTGTPHNHPQPVLSHQTPAHRNLFRAGILR